MQKILDRLEKWRLERGLDTSQGFEFNLEKQVSFIYEEIGVEYLRADTEERKIDALCDAFVFSVNACALLDAPVIQSDIYFLERNICNKTDILKNCDILLQGNVKPEYVFKTIIRLCFTIIEDMGYNFKQCMNETLKEIESRTGAFNEETGKWEKFQTDEAKALWYSADYSKCK